MNLKLNWHLKFEFLFEIRALNIPQKKNYNVQPILYSQLMLILKIHICSNGIDILGNNLSITEFSLIYVPFHPEETLDECRNLNTDEPSCTGCTTCIHLRHPLNTYLSAYQRSVCMCVCLRWERISAHWKETVKIQKKLKYQIGSRKRGSIK